MIAGASASGAVLCVPLGEEGSVEEQDLGSTASAIAIRCRWPCRRVALIGGRRASRASATMRVQPNLYPDRPARASPALLGFYAAVSRATLFVTAAEQRVVRWKTKPCQVAHKGETTSPWNTDAAVGVRVSSPATIRGRVVCTRSRPPGRCLDIQVESVVQGLEGTYCVPADVSWIDVIWFISSALLFNGDHGICPTVWV